MNEVPMNSFKDYFPIRHKPTPHLFQKGDVLVLFGELFNRGYANGLVEERWEEHPSELR